MRKQLYLAVIERLKTITDAFSEPVIQHFDLWNHNVEFIEQETAFNCPAVFIEFVPINWKNLSMQIQEAEITIKLHVVTRWEDLSADGSASQEQALQLFDLLDSIKKVLSGLQGNGFSGFKRIGSDTNHDHEEIVESIEAFQVHVIDKC